MIWQGSPLGFDRNGNPISYNGDATTPIKQRRRPRKRWWAIRPADAETFMLERDICEGGGFVGWRCRICGERLPVSPRRALLDSHRHGQEPARTGRSNKP